MKIGFIGAGNMATALARGIGAPVVVSDVDAGRAQALAAELGGEALAGNAAVARAADLVILCHKPGQLDGVAPEVAGEARAVLSILAGVPLARLRAAYPGIPVYRSMPNTAVAIGAGVIGLVDDDGGDPALFAALQEALAPTGEVLLLPEAQLDVLMAVSSVAPAYLAVIAEAWIDAAVRRGMPAPTSARLVGASLDGAARLLREQDMDTLAVRRAVTSPGGVTARGLSALERGGLRTALDDAMDAVLDGGS